MKLLSIFCVVLTIGLSVNGLKLQLGDITKGTIGATTGILEKVPDVLPTPTEFFQTTKNLAAGYPFDVAFKLINAFCSAALSEKTIKPRHTPDISKMNMILKANDVDEKIPLLQGELLLASKSFNKDWPLVILITGWNTDYGTNWNPALDPVYQAYKCRGGINFLALDSAAYVDTLYTWSSLNTDAIGEALAQSLAKLIESYPIEKIHLVGHSLGAHIAGSTGRHLQYKTGKLLPRITGLDPANPCFNEGEVLTGLARGDAEFVDIIHTDSGALGKRDSIGDIDFYPNGLHPLPPGCLTIVCAHLRAWEFYAETVYPGREENFMGIKCRSITSLNSNSCPGKPIPMGFAVPRNLKGNYFLNTNGKSPFGQNDKGLPPICAK